MSQRDIGQLEQLRISAGNKSTHRTENESELSHLNIISKSATDSRSTTSTAPVKENWGWSGESPMIKKIHYLLTKETFAMAVKIFRFGAFVKCVPFELEFKTGESLRVRPFQKKWQWALWHIVTWITFAAVAFEYISFYFLWQRSSFGKEMALHIMYLLYSAWIFVYFLPLYHNPRACIVMLNHHDELMRNSSRLGMSRKHWASHLFVILSVYYLAWIMVFFNFVLVAFYLRQPDRSTYIYSVFPSSWKEGELKWILYGICAVFEFCWVGWGNALIILYFCYWLASIYNFNSSLNELRNKQYINETLIEAYLYLQYFCISFNDFNGGLFATGFSFVLGGSPALLIYLSLTTFDILSIFVYLGFPAFTLILMSLIVLFLPQHSKVQIKSTDAVDSFNHLRIGARPQSQNQSFSSDLINLSHLTDAERRGYLKRRAKAFRRLRIQISFFGAFSLDTSAIMMEQIINNVLLLLSF